MGTAVLASRWVTTSTAGHLLLIAALTLPLRVFWLLSFPIFWDEAIYLRWATDIWEQRTRMALLIPISDDGKQPLFMWLEAIAAYALPLFSDPLLAARAVSALAGVASAVGVYLAARWLAGSAVAFVAGVLYAVAPFTLWFDRMALADGLLNTAGIWTFAASVLTVTQVRSGRHAAFSGILMGLAMGAAIWTKMTAAFMLAFPLLVAVLLIGRERARTSAIGFGVGLAVFGFFAALLALMPDFQRILDKSANFSIDRARLFSFPLDLWWSHVATYWTWFDAYLPAPLGWLVLAAAARGLVARPRLALLLLGCWAAITLPPVLMARKMYTSRYVMPGVFPLLILTADFLVWGWYRLVGWARGRFPHLGVGRLRARAMPALLLVAVIAPSLAFDYRLLTAPESAPLAPGDREEYVAGWPSGYGFMDALRVLKERAVELTRDGQPIILISDEVHGLPNDGLRVYMRRMPNVFHYVDMHLARDWGGFMAAWRPHCVPVLVIGNHGSDDLESFERWVPQAKRIAYSPKPTGRFSFRVYEVDVKDFCP